MGLELATVYRALGSKVIAEAARAIETECEAGDIAGMIHPHPTFSESLAQASEVAEGTVTELFLGRGKG